MYDAHLFNKKYRNYRTRMDINFQLITQIFSMKSRVEPWQAIVVIQALQTVSDSLAYFLSDWIRTLKKWFVKTSSAERSDNDVIVECWYWGKSTVKNVLKLMMNDVSSDYLLWPNKFYLFWYQNFFKGKFFSSGWFKPINSLWSTLKLISLETIMIVEALQDRAYLHQVQIRVYRVESWRCFSFH